MPTGLLFAAATVTGLVTEPAPNDNGRHIQLRWDAPAAVQVYRAECDQLRAFGDDWQLVKTFEEPTAAFTDEVPKGDASYCYAVRTVGEGGALGPPAIAGPERAVAAWFHSKRAFILAFVVGTLALLVHFLERAKRAGKKMYIRRIPGIDALEEAIGRSTEMGRPVLYVPGIDEIQNIQTIAGLLILGHVSEMVARYDTEVKVPCTYALNMVVAEEIVRQGFYNAGRPDAHKPQNVMYISSEQFAFCAGTNGIILRDKPATNIYLGRFFAESLILAETGYVNKAIQIAGTAEITQLPFFIAACDYTIIGEELYAVSAYLSREPKLLSALKASDYMKALIILLTVAGAMLSTFDVVDLRSWILP